MCHQAACSRLRGPHPSIAYIHGTSARPVPALADQLAQRLQAQHRQPPHRVPSRAVEADDVVRTEVFRRAHLQSKRGGLLSSLLSSAGVFARVGLGQGLGVIHWFMARVRSIVCTRIVVSRGAAAEPLSAFCMGWRLWLGCSVEARCGARGPYGPS